MIHEGPTGVFGAVFPDVPGCCSAGDSWEEAVVGAHAALSMHMRLLAADGDPIPRPGPLARVRRSADAAPAARGGTVSFAPIVLMRPASRPVRINVSLDGALLAAIDAWAERHGETRSGMLAAAARARLLA